MKVKDFWEGKRVFVTGATGIVGSWVVKDLVRRGAYVVVLVFDSDPATELYRSGTINRVHVVNGTVEDFRTVERAIVSHEADTVIHLAAQALVAVGQRAPLPTLEVNVRGTWNLLEACRLHTDLVHRVVIASSDKAYGEHAALPYTENLPLEGRQPYEVSKSCADLIAMTYFQTYGLPVAVARCGNIYGGGDLNWSRIVPGTIRSLYQGESPVLRCDGHFIRDYVYVKDVSRAYLELAEHLTSPEVQGEAFNFSAQSRVSVLEIVDRIRKLMNCDHIEATILDQAKGEIRNQYLSSEKAKRLLGWNVSFSLDDGLKETIEWYRIFFQEAG